MTEAMAKEKATVKYDSQFTKKVYEMENGKWVKMCMQCGICPTTCALKEKMDLSPRRIIQLIRAGRKDEVLQANTMWLCTSCYACACRCPRGVPMMDVMHDLRHLAVENGINHNSQSMAEVYAKDVSKRGRIWEGGLTLNYGLKIGLGNFFKMALDMQDIGKNMMFHRRLTLLPPKGVKNPGKLREVLSRAAEIAKREGAH
ncbi:putative heterodisulfide reductase, C subunit [Desulforamulus reducens MI-1]|uniref:Putative heterodisulfide reductase, C subunit n=1 Tax=Desulforamulus reducens (strain ATCC BAA-1160 / DSM 100696 / MI-1) TaxID=349161 RepID=A4J270_DESRM|nr:4Fe-4S dicluster domain-containing protein [Desulforamulus reducens]ABO49173.1 putative heterodisulfide reductase, C subunit [Desulforamulus reducens MI-1]